MSGTKKALKSIKAQLEGENYEAALYEASELRKKIKQTEPEAAQLLIFQGLALARLHRLEEAEKSYLLAYKLQPSNPLSAVGLRRLYEKKEDWEKLGRFFEVLVQDAFDQNDGERCATMLQELIELRSPHGPEDKLYCALQLLLPSSPLVTLIQQLPPPSGSYTPLTAPQYPPQDTTKLPVLPSPLPHVLLLQSSLPLVLTLLVRQQAIVSSTIEAQVKQQRTRLGAGTEKDVRKRVEGEVLGGQMGLLMVDLLREVGNHPATDDDVRRDVEVREFDFWRKLVSCLSDDGEAKKSNQPSQQSRGKSNGAAEGDLPPTPLFDAHARPKPSKADALARANSLAEGFVLLGLDGAAEDGWRWMIEGKDEPSIFYDIDLLHKFAKTFPTSVLTDFIDDYCRWFKRPLPEPEEEGPAPVETNGEPAIAQKPKSKRQKWRRRPGQNARDRRRARRLAVKEGELAEDLDEEEKEELVASMTKLLDRLPKSLFAHRVMARISIQEEDWANAVAYAEKGRALLKELETDRGSSMPATKISLDTALGVALVPYFAPKHHPQATRLLNSVLSAAPTDIEARFARAQIYQAEGRWADARIYFQQILGQGALDEKDLVAAKEEVGWCLVNEGQLEQGRDVLEEVVQVRDERWEREGKTDEAFVRARAWYRLGETEWRIGDDESKEHAEQWFMASIRALPTYAPAYTALGIRYSSTNPPDDDRALKCFQKAFELDATEAEAARRLAIGYADNDEWALVRAIAVRVMEGEGGVDGVAGGEVMNAKGRFAPKNGWAWKALGSTEMFYRNYGKAAQALQIALRADPDEVSTWLLLGESYVKCGRHMAALKALNKCLELDPDLWMALYYVADINVQLGQYEKAIEAYEKVQGLTDGEVGVVAAMASAELALGQQMAASGFRERARGAYHRAITHAGNVLRAGTTHRAWGWKLVGDACFQLATQEQDLPAISESAAVIHPVMEVLVADDTDRKGAVDGLGHAVNFLQSTPDVLSTLRAAVHAFAYRAYLCKNDRTADAALYDLATSLHTLAMHMREEKSEPRAQLIKGAISAIRLALERDAGDERLWNALGVVCGEAGKQLAQHAFVVSLELYAKDPITWTNLGYLYLRLDDLELANQCFLKAQIIDPDYARAWLGQGLLADRDGDGDQARALLGHAVTLSAGSLLEADLAASATAFERFLQPGIVDPNALHQPAFALKHYTNQRPYDWVAAHLYALICERLGLVEDAAGALETATRLLEEEWEHSESPEIEIRYGVALCNLGRVRLATKAYKKALDAYNDCWGLIEGSQDATWTTLRVQVRLGQAIAQFWIKDEEAALEAFQHALDEAAGSGRDGVKEDVAVLLARTLWGLGDEDAKDMAKTHLMDWWVHGKEGGADISLGTEKPSIKVLTALASIAMASKDADLSEAAMSELRALPLERRTYEDPDGLVELVLATQELADDHSNEGIEMLSGGVLAHPGMSEPRNRLAKALIASGRQEEASELLGAPDVPWDSGASALKGVARLQAGDEAGVRDIQRGIKVRPWDQEAWTGLAWARGIIADAEAA